MRVQAEMLSKKKDREELQYQIQQQACARCDCMSFVHPCMRVQAEMLSKKKDREAAAAAEAAAAEAASAVAAAAVAGALGAAAREQGVCVCACVHVCV